MKQKDYVSIVTCFDGPQTRNIEYLGNLYNDKDFLKDKIHSLFDVIESSDLYNKSILIKPNWVREDKKEDDWICLRTNDNLLLVLLEKLLSYKPSNITIADAPIQDCKWEVMLSDELLAEIHRLSQESHIPVTIKDFRRVVTDFKTNNSHTNIKSMDNYLLFDVGEKSFLEPITKEKNKFRVTNYSPKDMASAHHRGVHKYCVTKDVFTHDVIITVPKLKTHRMAGLTNSLKILIGINGDKQYLPHHRIGAKSHGGDCYKNYNLFRDFAEKVFDMQNNVIGSPIYKPLSLLSTVLWKLSKPGKQDFANAGWYGNDTIWRTVMDLNYIAQYGKSDGSLAPTPQRKLLTLVDGLVGGQADGPLFPKPSPLGCLYFSDNPYLSDVIGGYLYSLDINKIPLIKNAYDKIESVSTTILINNNISNIDQVKSLGIEVKMPPGWVGYDKQ